MTKPNLSPMAAAIAAVPALALLPDTAAAYVGPGAGLTAIGTVVALFAALGLALVGFVWYPVKRLLKRPAPAAAPARRDDADGGGQ